MNTLNLILTALVWCCVAAVLARELVGLALWWRIIQAYRTHYQAPVRARVTHARHPAPLASLPDDPPDDPLVIEQARRMMDPGTDIGC